VNLISKFYSRKTIFLMQAVLTCNVLHTCQIFGYHKRWGMFRPTERLLVFQGGFWCVELKRMHSYCVFKPEF